MNTETAKYSNHQSVPDRIYILTTRMSWLSGLIVLISIFVCCPGNASVPGIDMTNFEGTVFVSAIFPGTGANVAVHQVSSSKPKPDVRKIYGRIQIVNHFPDYRVKIVNHFPDLRVQRVNHFPNRSGRWQIVENFPDYRIQIVEHFPDFTIQWVDHFPGSRE